MVRRIAKLPIAILLLVVGLVSSCEPIRNPCMEPTLATVKVYVVQQDVQNKSVKDTLLPKANVYCLDIDSAGNWYREALQINKFELVLTPLRDTVRWVLQPDADMPYLDTVYFQYQKQLFYYSAACGYGYQYRLDTLWSSRHVIREVTIMNADVNTNPDLKNVQILF